MIRWTGEAEIGDPYWWDEAQTVRCTQMPPERVDILVIGGGYTGLSAARVAHDGGAAVAVLDAGDIGAGASTRNGGMFGAHPRLSWSALQRQFGDDTADAIMAEARPAQDWVRALIAAEQIDCDLQTTGRIQLAWTAAHFEAQQKLAADLGRASTVSAQVVGRADLGREIATERYFGGLLFPEHCAIHPRKLHHGLLRAVMGRGVPVAADCPALELTRTPHGFDVRTPRGTIRAEKVILATNGYTPGTFPWHKKRVFALPSYLIATEELPDNLIGHLAPGRRMMVETRARHSYFRLSPDGRRILFGGRAAMRPIPLEHAAQRLSETMCDIWPDLRGTRISHAWTGNTGYSFTHMPHVGEDAGLHFAMGYSGSGTVMAPYLGGKVAYRALGDPRGETAYTRTPFKSSWLNPTGAPHFLRAANLWYNQVVDRVQMRAGR